MTLVRLGNRDYAPARSSNFGMDDMLNWFRDELPGYGDFNHYPKANISETEDDFKIELLVPGYSKEDIRIQVENGILSVRYDLENTKDESSEKFINREFYKRDFHRKFKLSDRLASDKISAKYKHGVLEIMLPKKEEAKAKPVQEIKIS